MALFRLHVHLECRSPKGNAMTTTQSRDRVLTGCLATILLLATPIDLARTKIEPTPPRPIGGGAQAHAGGLWAALATDGLLWAPSDWTALASKSDATPWSRRTFVSFRGDGARATQASLKSGPAASSGEAPGTVQNFRRTDKR
jgi:hypothetical protein